MLKKIVVSTVVAGSLAAGSLGLASVAGAAGTPSGPSAHLAAASQPPSGQPNCQNAGDRIARLQKVEARIAAGLPKLNAAQLRAAQNGHPKLAARLQQALHKLGSAKVTAVIDRRIGRLQAACGIAPSNPQATS